ncbi:MAG: hypothetical protein OHK0011_01240 [Turneriella sp.]
MLSTKWVLAPALAVILCAGSVQAQGSLPAAEKVVNGPASSNDAAPAAKATTNDNEPPAPTDDAPKDAIAEPTNNAVKPIGPVIPATEPAVPPVSEPPVAEKRAEPAPEPPAPAAHEFQLMTGVHSGLMIPFNGIHSVGYNFGMTLDYTMYRRYGIQFGAETGVLPARAQTLPASPADIAVLDGGTFGFLNLRLAGMYVFPKIRDLNPSAGFGLAYYQLSGGSYDFKASIAPVAVGSLYYDILPNLQLGVMGQFILATTGKITTTGAEYTLRSATWLTTASLAVSVRYAWF